MMKERFEDIFTLEERMNAYKHLLPKLQAEGRVAVIFQRGKSSSASQLRIQALMKGYHTISDAAKLIRREVLVSSTEAVFLYSSANELLRPSLSMSSLVSLNPSEDGFLYLYYVDSPGFGFSFTLFQDYKDNSSQGELAENQQQPGKAPRAHSFVQKNILLMR